MNLLHDPYRPDPYWATLKRIREIIRERQIAIEKLTENQIVEAFMQAIKAGDFQVHILAESSPANHVQRVIYAPYREVERLRAENQRLRTALDRVRQVLDNPDGDDPVKRMGSTHGIDCLKVAHEGDGYLHSESDDSPYLVDGAPYCGRCHMAL